MALKREVTDAMARRHALMEANTEILAEIKDSGNCTAQQDNRMKSNDAEIAKAEAILGREYVAYITRDIEYGPPEALNDSLAWAESDARKLSAGRSGPVTPARQKGGHGPKFNEMFGQFRAESKFPNSEEFLRAVHSGQFHPGLRPMASMGESLGSTGGFSVPEPLSAQWLDSSLEDEIVRSRCRIFPMTSNVLNVPGWDVSDNSATLFGGISAQWLGEGASATDSEPAMRQLKLEARKLAIFSKISNEAVADGVGLSQQLGMAMQQALGFSLDYAFLQGDGVGKPLGVLKAPSLITVAKEGSQVNDTIVYRNLCQMLTRLHPRCFANAIWIAHHSTRTNLLELSIPIGTSGSHVPVLTEGEDGWRILTLPCVFTEKTAALGDLGDVVLVDLSQYCVGMRREISLEASQHVGWQTDETGFRTIMRVDGKPIWSSVRTPKTGATLSWAVTLAAR